MTVNTGEAAPQPCPVALSGSTPSDVVSIGYGSQRRVDLTGSISSVNSEDLHKTIVTTVEQGLQGRVPGVQVHRAIAAPGGGDARPDSQRQLGELGSSQPLCVIDGVPFEQSGISKRQIGATSEENLSSLTETNPLVDFTE